MARVLIVDRAGRAERVADVLREREFAVRTVDADPLLPGHVFDALDGVTVVCWLMGAGEGLHPRVNDEQLETVLLKVVDTGVRGFVFEQPTRAANPHVDHARATWHIPIAEIETGEVPVTDEWLRSVADAVDQTLGVTR